MDDLIRRSDVIGLIEDMLLGPFKKDQINHDFDKCIDDMIKGMKGYN